MALTDTLFPRHSIWLTDGRMHPYLGDRRSPMGERRVVILVHGYNNDRVEAETSYRLMMTKLEHLVDPARLRSVWYLFWPAYTEGLLPGLRRRVTQRLRRKRVPMTESNLMASAPLYSLQVAKARTVGTGLGQYLLQLFTATSQCEVVLIAHSLGCRVALEAAREITIALPAQRRQLRTICLMAAAVPAMMVWMGARLSVAARCAQRTYVLYSRKDFVLGWLFRPGQALAGEGYRSKAVGLHGDPMIWSGADETMLGHSDYWHSSVTTPHLARLFGVATPEL